MLYSGNLRLGGTLGGTKNVVPRIILHILSDRVFCPYLSAKQIVCPSLLFKLPLNNFELRKHHDRGKMPLRDLLHIMSKEIYFIFEN